MMENTESKASGSTSYRRLSFVVLPLALLVVTQLQLVPQSSFNWINNDYATESNNGISPVLNSSLEADSSLKNTPVTTSESKQVDSHNTQRKPAETLSNTTSLQAPLNRSNVVPNHNDELPACQIRVSNIVLTHYEVIESVAKLIPHEYLNLPDTCNHRDLYFEFSVKSDGSVRPRTWLADFNNRATNTSTLDNSTGIQRSYGPATTLGSSSRTDWDTTIQASCYCSQLTKAWLLDTTSSDAPHVCIHHGVCNWTSGMPNAIYMSPHHERYIVPSALPQQSWNNVSQKGGKSKLEICTIGSTGRRKWTLFTPFFENPSKNEKYFDKIRIRMLGRGHMPPLMAQYKNWTEVKCKQLNDDRKFYAMVMACDMIILPIDKEGVGRNYFKSPPGSEWKLSGTIPPIIAYQKSFMLPQELVELYHKELPMHMPHRGYDDESDTSFAEALSSLLSELLAQRY